jgi:uncharacterized protein YyaL (SSP411 family)
MARDGGRRKRPAPTPTGAATETGTAERRRPPAAALRPDVALLRDKPQTDKATAYVCERFVCQAPTSDATELASQLS